MCIRDSVGIVCITVMVSIGVIDSETFGMVDWNSWKQLWQMLYEEIGPEFWVAMAWTCLLYTSTMDKIVMIEAGANEVDEDTMLNAIKAAHAEIKKIITFINGIVAERGKPKIDFQVVMGKNCSSSRSH